MHKIAISPAALDRMTERMGKQHPFGTIEPRKAALLVIDMQNYFVKRGVLGEIPLARDIVPNINRLARRPAPAQRPCHVDSQRHERHAGQLVDFPRMPNDAGPQRAALRGNGYRRRRLHSGLFRVETYLRDRGIDTLLIAGTATNICCESSARDAMMLNFKVIMVSDALATHTDEEHNATLSAFYGQFGDVQTTDEALQALERGDITRAAA